MKRIIVLVALSLVMLHVFGQRKTYTTIKWLSITPKVGYGNSVLMNKSTMTDENVVLDTWTPSSFAGLRLGITFGDHVFFGVEGHYSSFGQDYDLLKVGTYRDTYIKKLRFTSLDYLVLLRYTGYSGIYIEAGHKVSTFINASEKNITNSEYMKSAPFMKEDTLFSFLSLYKKDFPSYVIGIGLAPIRKERLEIYMGVRFNWAYDDIYGDTNQSYPLNDNVYNDKIYYYDHYIENRSDTKPLSVQLVFELNYIFGFWGDARCGKGRLKLFQ